jgi:hypothetical protein
MVALHLPILPWPIPLAINYRIPLSLLPLLVSVEGKFFSLLAIKLWVRRRGDNFGGGIINCPSGPRIVKNEGGN